ncbi:hypothetical protein H7X46_02535 [Pseudonocardia sp. C8]|uniref:DUF6069 family protein n=1 Tax=Pseudonocardia sp. C8 TaxID=2762759 RepID=UPI0016423AD6|nr:DUF6069 family protein [Pseudonocardia sp. C8]MBC3189939.1 hypothetical protein [Pseudonocardia sp. C8]
MSTTHITAAPARTIAAPSAGSLLRDGALATVVAAAATAVVAAAGQAAGISLAIAGTPIPPSGFATMTVIFSVLGLVIALGLRRFARSPRTAWIRTTVVLTVLSFVPDVIADAAVATKVFLMLTHVVAAAIVIPAVARRLS